MMIDMNFNYKFIYLHYKRFFWNYSRLTIDKSPKQEIQTDEIMDLLSQKQQTSIQKKVGVKHINKKAETEVLEIIKTLKAFYYKPKLAVDLFFEDI